MGGTMPLEGPELHRRGGWRVVHTQTGSLDSQNLFASPEGNGHHGRRAKPR